MEIKGKKFEYEYLPKGFMTYYFGDKAPLYEAVLTTTYKYSNRSFYFHLLAIAPDCTLYLFNFAEKKDTD